MFALPKWVAYIAGPYLQAMLILSYIMSQNSNEVYNHSVNTRAICTCSEPCQHACTFCPLSFPAGSPSRGEDVTVYFSDINQPSLPTLFFLILFLCPFMSLWSFKLYFIPWILPTTHRFLTPFFWVLFLPYWSFQLYISLWQSPSALI